VADGVVKTAFGDDLQGFRLGRLGFECADDEQLNTWHERLNVLWRNLASPHIALWTHLVRGPGRAATDCATGAGFADALHARYQNRLSGERLMANELYLTVLYRPASGLPAGIVSRVLA